LDKLSKDYEIGRERVYEIIEQLKKTKAENLKFRLVNRTNDLLRPKMMMMKLQCKSCCMAAIKCEFILLKKFRCRPTDDRCS